MKNALTTVKREYFGFKIKTRNEVTMKRSRIDGCDSRTHSQTHTHTCIASRQRSLRVPVVRERLATCLQSFERSRSRSLLLCDFIRTFLNSLLNWIQLNFEVNKILLFNEYCDDESVIDSHKKCKIIIEKTQPKEKTRKSSVKSERSFWFVSRVFIENFRQIDYLHGRNENKCVTKDQQKILIQV